MVMTQVQETRAQNRESWPWELPGAVFSPRHDILLSDWLTGRWTRAVEEREAIGGRSVLITRDRDLQGRLTGIEFVDDNTRQWLRSIEIDYDEAGRLAEFQDSTEHRCYRLAYTYDFDGMLAEETLFVWSGEEDRSIRTAIHASEPDHHGLRRVEVVDWAGRRIEEGRYDVARGVLESRHFRGDGRVAKFERTEYHDDGRIQRVSRFVFDARPGQEDEHPTRRFVEDYGYYEVDGTLRQRKLVEEVRDDGIGNDADWSKRAEETITYAFGTPELPVRDESRFFERLTDGDLTERQRLAIDYTYDDLGRLISLKVEESDLSSGESRHRVSTYDHRLLDDDLSVDDEDLWDFGLDVDATAVSDLMEDSEAYEHVSSIYRKDGELKRRTIYQGGTRRTLDFVVFE